MAELLDKFEKRLLNTREKIRTTRREITGGVAEDKARELGKKVYNELDEDLEALSKAIKEQRAQAKERRAKIYDELEESVSAARTKLRNKRRDITGGVVENKAKDAGRYVKEKGGAALKEIEEDISKISEKLKKAKEEEY
ncbi:MAG: hypothetical protein JSW00_03240 [Thermoplasmata archaeon]|nr:MAG: hypothetical protein JSW00_03240 [Thermoplasmata archaeon]